MIEFLYKISIFSAAYIATGVLLDYFMGIIDWKFYLATLFGLISGRALEYFYPQKKETSAK